MTEQTSAVRIMDIRHGMRNLTVTGKVAEIGEVRTVETKFGPAKVAAATLEDHTGSIRLNLWRDQIEAVRVGDTIRLQNAFVRVFNYQNELNIGKDGKVKVLSRP